MSDIFDSNVIMPGPVSLSSSVGLSANQSSNEYLNYLQRLMPYL